MFEVFWLPIHSENPTWTKPSESSQYDLLKLFNYWCHIKSDDMEQMRWNVNAKMIPTRFDLQGIIHATVHHTIAEAWTSGNISRKDPPLNQNEQEKDSHIFCGPEAINRCKLIHANDCLS